MNEGFFRFLLPYYSSVQKNHTKAAINSFVDDLRSGNVEQFLQRLQSFFADFQYDAQTTPESHFRNVLYILCKLMGLQVDAEYQTSDGRIDLLLRTDKFVYVIECKIDSTARIALDQIKSKEYALPWFLDNRETILIGINFSTTTRRPDNWLIERADGSIIEGGQKKWSEISGQKKVVRNRGKNTAVIFGLIKANPSITRDQLSAEVHIAPSAVQKHIEKLKQGYIVRADGDRGGYWVILKEWEA